MVLKSFADLAAGLEAAGVTARQRPDGETLELETRVDGAVGKLLVSWSARREQVQIVCPVPGLVVGAEARAAVEHAIVRVNHDLVAPGFGLEPGGGRVYFRTTGWRDAGGISFAVFRAQVTVALATVRRFRPLFLAVAAGKLDVDAALAQAAPMGGHGGDGGYPLPID